MHSAADGPRAMSIARRSNINPVPLFIGMAISSNLQGAATLIGDPPSMLLAGYARLSFNDFFIYGGQPGIFFAVQVAALLSALVLLFFFRKDDRRMPSLERHPYGSIVPIGASANIVAMGILKRHGYESRFFQFVRMGLPFTLVAVLSSSLLVWILFGR